MAKNLSLIADNKVVVYSDTAGDSVTIYDRTATRESSEPVIWTAHAWPDSSYFGWVCIGLSESAVKLTAKTDYAGSTIHKIVSHGVAYYVAQMDSRVKLDSENTMRVETSRFTVNVPAIESSIFRYDFQSTDYTDDSFFDKIIAISHSVSKSGDTMTGSLTVNGTIKAGEKIKIWTDNEGGNLELISPSNTLGAQMDLCNDTQFRLYTFDVSPWNYLATLWYNKSSDKWGTDKPFTAPNLQEDGTALSSKYIPQSDTFFRSGVINATDSYTTLTGGCTRFSSADPLKTGYMYLFACEFDMSNVSNITQDMEVRVYYADKYPCYNWDGSLSETSATSSYTSQYIRVLTNTAKKYSVVIPIVPTFAARSFMIYLRGVSEASYKMKKAICSIFRVSNRRSDNVTIWS